MMLYLADSFCNMYACHVDTKKQKNKFITILSKYARRKVRYILYTACKGWIIYYTKEEKQ